MFFLDREHKHNFTALVQQFGKELSREYLAAYYVLSADEELRRKAACHIHKDGISWDAIWNEDWSSGYRLLLELAESLFRSGGEINLAYGLRIWDDNLFKIAMQAILLRRNGLT